MPMKVTAKGQVTIPKAIRDLLGIEPGSNVTFALAEDGSESWLGESEQLG